jgi:hypothetical protein
VKAQFFRLVSWTLLSGPEFNPRHIATLFIFKEQCARCAAYFEYTIIWWERKWKYGIIAGPLRRSSIYENNMACRSQVQQICPVCFDYELAMPEPNCQRRILAQQRHGRISIYCKRICRPQRGSAKRKRCRATNMPRRRRCGSSPARGNISVENDAFDNMKPRQGRHLPAECKKMGCAPPPRFLQSCKARSAIRAFFVWQKL